MRIRGVHKLGILSLRLPMANPLRGVCEGMLSWETLIWYYRVPAQRHMRCGAGRSIPSWCLIWTLLEREDVNGMRQALSQFGSIQFPAGIFEGVSCLSVFEVHVHWFIGLRVFARGLEMAYQGFAIRICRSCVPPYSFKGYCTRPAALC